MENQQSIELNNKGVQFFLNGQFDQAESLYRQALEADSENASVLNNLGLLYHQQRAFDKAISYFEQAIAIDEKPNFLVNLGNSLAMMGKMEKAEATYTLVTEKYPDHEQAWVSLAKFMVHLGRLGEAASIWKQLSNKFNKSTYQLELAKTLLDNKNYNESYKILNELSINEYHPDIWFQKGRCEFHLKNHGLSEKSLKKALAEQPDEGNYRYYLALNYLAMGQVEEGLYQIDFILKMDPDNYRILTEKGVILCSIQQFDLARKYFEQALSISPNYQKALHYQELTYKQK